MGSIVGPEGGGALGGGPEVGVHVCMDPASAVPVGAAWAVEDASELAAASGRGVAAAAFDVHAAAASAAATAAVVAAAVTGVGAAEGTSSDEAAAAGA